MTKPRLRPVDIGAIPLPVPAPVLERYISGKRPEQPHTELLRGWWHFQIAGMTYAKGPSGWYAGEAQ